MLNRLSHLEKKSINNIVTIGGRIQTKNIPLFSSSDDPFSIKKGLITEE